MKTRLAPEDTAAIELLADVSQDVWHRMFEFIKNIIDEGEVTTKGGFHFYKKSSYNDYEIEETFYIVECDGEESVIDVMFLNDIIALAYTLEEHFNANDDGE